MNTLNQINEGNDSNLFSKNLYNNICPDGIEFHYWNRARFKIIHHLLKKMNLLFINGLSIGCGRGLDVMVLRNYGINIIGVEPSNAQPFKSIEKYITTNPSSFSLHAKSVYKINTIFLLEALEHIASCYRKLYINS